MKAIRPIILASLMGATTLNAGAWGQKGHDTTCFIAECHLTPATRAAVENLLGNHSMVYYANWLDNASHTPEYAYSKTWHYKNIDEGVEYNKAPLAEKGDIVRAIYAQVETLQNGEATEEEKSLALKMLIHLLGDIHQPMHMGHLSDLGGNRWDVRFFKKPTNLHSVWDSSLPESAHKWSYTEWQQQLDRIPEAGETELIKEGTPEKWGEETYTIATDIYKDTPRDTNISYDYIAKWTPVVEQQFMKGGLRLADLLNSIFDPSYKGSNRIVKNGGK